MVGCQVGLAEHHPTRSAIYCGVVLTASPYWTFGMTWPPADVEGNKVKHFLRVNPGGMEHFQTGIVTTSLYYSMKLREYKQTIVLRSKYLSYRRHGASPRLHLTVHYIRSFKLKLGFFICRCPRQHTEAWPNGVGIHCRSSTPGVSYVPFPFAVHMGPAQAHLNVDP